MNRSKVRLTDRGEVVLGIGIVIALILFAVLVSSALSMLFGVNDIPNG